MKINEGHLYVKRLAELISGTKIVDLEVQRVKERLNCILLGRKYPGVTEVIEDRINESDSAIPYDTISNLPPETFLNFLRNSFGIDFENMGIQESELALKDIPVQYKESRLAGVEDEFNGTIGVLVDEKGHIIINPEVKKVLQDNLGLEFDDETINNLVKYHPGDGLALFQEVYTRLIKKEEETYDWGEMNATPTKPFFIPGGSSGLTIFRDYFLEEGSLVIVPNYRWPNIDGMVMNKTKVPPAVANIFDSEGNINFDNIDEILEFSQESGRKKVGIYLNFPNNPTGLNFGQKEADELNKILSKYPDLEINIVIDDPYGAFALKDNLDVKTPISYLIDIENNKNITLLELGSHGTKEAGVYGLRMATMRGLTHSKNKDDLEKKLSLAIRQTFSMSSSIPQVVILKAILGKEVDVFADGINLSDDEIDKRISRYLESRKEMSSNIFTRINDFRNNILNEVGDYLTVIGGKSEGINGFYLNFILTDLGKENGIDLENLRNICINNTGVLGRSIKCSFSVFEDTISGNQCIRISLISGDTKEYAKRLKSAIQILIK